MLYMSAYDVMSANQNLHKQAFIKRSNIKTKRKCVKVLIKCLIFPKFIQHNDFHCGEVDHSVRKHTLQKLLRNINCKV